MTDLQEQALLWSEDSAPLPASHITVAFITQAALLGHQGMRRTGSLEQLL